MREHFETTLESKKYDIWQAMAELEAEQQELAKRQEQLKQEHKQLEEVINFYHEVTNKLQNSTTSEAFSYVAHVYYDELDNHGSRGKLVMYAYSLMNSLTHRPY